MNFSLETLEPYFQENFSQRDELGAAVSIWQGEEEVISLANGKLAKDSEVDWTADTLVPIWSATKGPAALTVLMVLHEAGISVSAPVQDVWRFLKAARDKGLNFAQLLAHQSGLAALDPDNRPSILNHSEVAKALENQDPFWQAGFGHGYHPRTCGALMDEIVRRVTDGTTLGQYWREKIAAPLGLDIFIGGLGAAEIDRLATIYPPKRMVASAEEKEFYNKLGDPQSLPFSAFASPSGIKGLGEINKIENLQSGIPSLGGVASARGLGKFYAILANRGHWKGVQVIPQSIVDSLSDPISQGEDYTLLIPTAFSTGFMLDPINPDTGEKHRRLFGPSRKAFGQPGAGGSHAFADPENNLAFGYVMNQMEAGILPNNKSLGLVERIYS